MTEEEEKRFKAAIDRAADSLEKRWDAISDEHYSIIAMHFELERQVEKLLATRLPRAEHLSRLGFTHKVSVLQAMTKNKHIDMVARALLTFNDLRNCVAHHDQRAIEKALKKTSRSLDLPGDQSAEDPSIATVAMSLHGILQLLADESSLYLEW